MSELNPNHPVTATVHDHWHKLCAFALFKFGVRELEITEDDIADFEEWLGADAGIVADARGNRFVLRLVNGAEAQRLVREAGGLPT